MIKLLNITKYCIVIVYIAISSINASNFLSFWIKADKLEQEYFNEVISEFKEYKDNNVAINVKYSGTDEITRDVVKNFEQNPQNPKLPNIIYTANDLAGYFAYKGYIIPLDDLVGKVMLRRFNLNSLFSGKYDEKQYMLPEAVGNNVVLFYNKDLVSEPKDFNDFEAQAKQYMLNNRSSYGLVYPNYSAYYMIGFFNGYGGAVFNKKGEITLNTPAMEAALALTRELTSLGKLGMSDAESVQAFISKKSPFLLAITDQAVLLNKNNMNFGIMPMVMPGNRVASHYSSSKGFMVTNTNHSLEAQDLIKEFFEFYFDDKRYKKFVSIRKTAPSIKAVDADKEINKDKLIGMIKNSLYAHNILMPIVPSMRAVWDGIIPNLKNYLDQKIDGDEATFAMQKEAEKNNTALMNIKK